MVALGMVGHRTALSATGVDRMPVSATRTMLRGAWVRAASGAARRGIRSVGRPLSTEATTARATASGSSMVQGTGSQDALEGGRGRRVARDAAHHVRGDRADLDGEGADRPAAQVGAQPGGEVREPGLGGAVRREAGERGDARERGDVDEVAPASAVIPGST